MKHTAVPTKLGFKCSCDQTFVKEELLLNHIEAENKPKPIAAEPASKAKVEVVEAKTVLTGASAISAYLNNDAVKELVRNRINGNPSPFISSIMTAVNGNPQLANCTPKSILGAAIEASALDLSVNPNLGQAYLVPYKDQAQLQVGYKGYIQLAQRSGQYKTIAATPVYEGQLADQNPLTGNTYDWSAKTSDTIIGYVAYFKLLNGFEKEWYMTVEQVRAHAQRFSQSFRKGFGPWKDHEERMSLKTPLRFLLNTYGLLSVELQRAIEVDQGVIQDDVIEYVDNMDELTEAINAASTRSELSDYLNSLPVDQRKAIAGIAEARLKELGE